MNYFCLALEQLQGGKHICLLTINLKVIFFCRLLQGSELVKQRQTGGDDSTSSQIHELFGLTRVLQAVMNMDHKLDQSLTITLHSLVEQTSLHPWGFLSLNALYKDSFLVCIVTRRIEARNFLTHAAKGPWESMRCTI